MEGERVSYERDRLGNTVMVTETRRLVKHSTTAVVTPSRVLDGFVQEGHVRNLVEARESVAQRVARARAAANLEKLEGKVRRRAIRLARRHARASDAHGGKTYEEGVHMARICNAPRTDVLRPP